MSSLYFDHHNKPERRGAVLPVPYGVLVNRLQLFADFDETAIDALDGSRIAVLPRQNPVRALLTLQGRPMPFRASIDRRDVLRHRKAYRTGVLMAASLLMQQEAVVHGNIERSLRVNTNQFVLGAIRETARRNERYIVSQFIDTTVDVRNDFREVTEQAWLRNSMSFLHGHEHDAGHNDFVLIGAGDTIAEFALRDLEWSVGDLQTEKLA